MKLTWRRKWEEKWSEAEVIKFKIETLRTLFTKLKIAPLATKLEIGNLAEAIAKMHGTATEAMTEAEYKTHLEIDLWEWILLNDRAEKQKWMTAPH